MMATVVKYEDLPRRAGACCAGVIGPGLSLYELGESLKARVLLQVSSEDHRAAPDIFEVLQ